MAAPSEYNLDEPWSRQPFDGDVSWVWFQNYLLLPPPRRLGDLRGCPLSTSQLQYLEWEHGWKERAQLWDRHLDRLRFETVEQVTREDARARAERHARAARKLIALGEAELDKLLEMALRPNSGAGLIQVKDLIRAIVLGVRTERLALGDVTENIQTGPDLSALSVEDLRALREMQQKAEQGRT